jgi:hypothetical protein
MAILTAALAQVVLTLSLDGQPVRIGLPLPAAAVARGLRVAGNAVGQWRRLPIGGADADPVWVELACVGRGEVRWVAGGEPAAPDGAGSAVRREQTRRELPWGSETQTRWYWSTGETDAEVRSEFAAPAEVDGERFAAGEALTRWNVEPTLRAAALCRLPRVRFVAAGLLPPGGQLAAEVRRELRATWPHLRELPGHRGAGDFARSAGVVTNLEYDTGLAVLRFALACGDPVALALAARCARHLRDRDLDRRSGLPFAHGVDHRAGAPTPGHAWLQGLLWTGLWLADDGLLATARAMGGALAANPPAGEGARELARDFAWPLLELEALLYWERNPVVAAAADRLAGAIASRYDAAAQAFRFGEGELGSGVRLERAWITGGIVLPALRAHLRRRPDCELAAKVHAVEQALLRQVTLAADGIPTHWRQAGGEVFAVHSARADPRAVLLFDGLPWVEQQRLLRRGRIRDWLSGALRADDPDLPTAWTLVARCQWVWR